MRVQRRTVLLGLLGMTAFPAAFADRAGRPAAAHTTWLQVQGQGLLLQYRPSPSPRLSCIDTTTRRQLFDAPVPALRTLWIAPGGRHVVVLSEGSTVWDEDRVLVFARDGTKLLERAIEGVPHPLRDAATDDPDTPFVALTGPDDHLTVTVRNRLGEIRAFEVGPVMEPVRP